MGGLLRDNPCKTCDKHCDICHSVCLYYKTWLEEYNKLKADEAKEKSATICMNRRENILKRLRRKGKVNKFRSHSQ